MTYEEFMAWLRGQSPTLQKIGDVAAQNQAAVNGFVGQNPQNGAVPWISSGRRQVPASQQPMRFSGLPNQYVAPNAGVAQANPNAQMRPYDYVDPSLNTNMARGALDNIRYGTDVATNTAGNFIDNSVRTLGFAAPTTMPLFAGVNKSPAYQDYHDAIMNLIFGRDKSAEPQFTEKKSYSPPDWISSVGQAGLDAAGGITDTARFIQNSVAATGIKPTAQLYYAAVKKGIKDMWDKRPDNWDKVQPVVDSNRKLGNSNPAKAGVAPTAAQPTTSMPAQRSPEDVAGLGIAPKQYGLGTAMDNIPTYQREGQKQAAGGPLAEIPFNQRVGIGAQLSGGADESGRNLTAAELHNRNIEAMKLYGYKPSEQGKINTARENKRAAKMQEDLIAAQGDAQAKAIGAQSQAAGEAGAAKADSASRLQAQKDEARAKLLEVKHGQAIDDKAVELANSKDLLSYSKNLDAEIAKRGMQEDLKKHLDSATAYMNSNPTYQAVMSREDPEAKKWKARMYTHIQDALVSGKFKDPKIFPQDIVDRVAKTDKPPR